MAVASLVAVVRRVAVLLMCTSMLMTSEASEDAKRLLDDLFSDYNSVVRPVSNPTDKIKLSIGLKLSQIAEIVCRPFRPTIIVPIAHQIIVVSLQDMKNQVMTTNVWLRHEWYDHKVSDVCHCGVMVCGSSNLHVIDSSPGFPNTMAIRARSTYRARAFGCPTLCCKHRTRWPRSVSMLFK
jgi:hypothetical protein